MKENWNKIFKTGRTFTLMNKIYLSELLSFIKKERGGKDIKNALDLGCGLGGLAINLAKKNIKTKGIDFSNTALDFAKKEAKKQEVSELVKFIEVDLNDIGEFSKEEKYDIIFNKLTYAFIKKKINFLRNINRLLNEKGFFILMTPVLITGEKYSDRLKNISVNRDDLEDVLKKEFKHVNIYHKNYFEDKGLEITYICKKK